RIVAAEPVAGAAGRAGGLGAELLVDDAIAGVEHPAEGPNDLGRHAGQDLPDGPAEVRLDGQAVELGQGRIEPDMAQLAVVEAEADRGVVEQGVEQGALGLQLAEEPGALGDGALVLGDVADDAGEEPPRAQAGLADGQLHGEDGAILATPVDLADGADDPRLPRAEVALEGAVVLLAVAARHQPVEAAADDLPVG